MAIDEPEGYDERNVENSDPKVGVDRYVWVQLNACAEIKLSTVSIIRGCGIRAIRAK